MKRTIPNIRIFLCALGLVLLSSNLIAQSTLVPYGSTWKYWSNTLANFPTGWQNSAFNDAAWPSGAGELGYGDGDETTCIPSGGGGTTCTPTGNKWVTAYFRKTVNIPNPAVYSGFTFNVKRDDGFVVYVNGTEVSRNNMPASPAVISYTTAASSAIEDAVISFTVPSASFSVGDNVIAVEIHQASTVAGPPVTSTSSDISFNLELIGNDLFSGTLLRGPYLQMGSQTGITIRWRTSAAQNSRVEIGTSFGTYPTVVTDATNVTEHIISITGLSPDTKYFYRIGNSTNMGAPDASKFFTTVPPSNANRKIRIAAFGDCGRNSATYQDQTLSSYQAFLTANSIEAPDAWILLGDNAYSTGSDAEYTSNFFGIYGNNLLKNHKLYPAPGNHDYGNNAGNKSSRAMPYYNSFTTPKLGELGGVASNKPNFYSFDIGNIHFLSLDSWGIESDLTDMGSSAASTLKTWVDADLAANTQRWTVAYWHHPPYTKTSHDSDNGGGGDPELPKIRQFFIPYLEARGVDLIICGHAHGYERSYMLKGFTTSWSSFNAGTHAVSTSSANYVDNASCPYVYNSSPLNHGAVYVVAGSAGASGGTQALFDTPPMPYSVNDGGVLYFETDDNRLDAKMIRRNGTIFDQFTIMKDVNVTSTYNIVVGNTINLQASWPGNYTWSNSATSRSINFTPLASGPTVFTVRDAFNCVQDQFTVNASNTLPVSILTFDVQLTSNGKVNLSWSTATETNNKYFYIERSSNGRDFTRIGTVNAVGNSTTRQYYTFRDEAPLSGTAYYRLSQSDVDGRVQHLSVKKVANNIIKDVEVKTLSTTNGVLVLQINSANQFSTQLKVYDMNGRERKSEKFVVMPGSTERRVTLGSGIYVWEIRQKNGETIFQKVIVQ